ncbi:cuticle protein 16.8-like isoform X1 [Ixodes scapularis]|uniref:cuticle protein 16.8-like isoform X1 n=1 Tax=Ixodes scapularis TaxID=6945 RepID=UPI001C390BC2|nr:cuticle protein 16.8-like isoform X1 [Ixodes scapularis]
MFSKVLLCCLVAYAAAARDPDGPPQPYNFNYDNTDEYGTRQTHEESGDANNNKVGSYSYTDPTGVQRTVRYTADATGFHVVVETNEPGTETHYPADAQIISSAPKVAPPPNPPRVQVRPVAVHTVHAAPVAVHAVHAAPVAVHAVHASPITLHAVHSTPVTLHAVHAAPLALHAAPVSYATAHHVTPVALSHAPLTYTLGRAKSR